MGVPINSRNAREQPKRLLGLLRQHARIGVGLDSGDQLVGRMAMGWVKL